MVGGRNATILLMGGMVPSTNVEGASIVPDTGNGVPKDGWLGLLSPSQQVAVLRGGFSPINYCYFFPPNKSTQTNDSSTHHCAHCNPAVSKHICLLRTIVEHPLQGNPGVPASEKRKHAMPASTEDVGGLHSFMGTSFISKVHSSHFQ